MKDTKKILHGTQNAKNCMCIAYNRFGWSALGCEKCTGLKREQGFWWATEAHKMRMERAKERYERAKWPKHGLSLRFGGPKSSVFDAKCSGSIFRNVLPTEGGEHIFKTIIKNWKKGCVKHEGHKEDTRHTKFRKLHVHCIQSFSLIGSCMQRVHRTQARARFLMGDGSA